MEIFTQPTGVLNPWDDGYVAPLPNLDDKKQGAAKGGKTTAERKKRMLEIDPDRDPFAAIPESANSKRLEAITADTITDEAKLRMDLFVTEYLHDFSAKKAWVRAGLSENTVQKAYEWLRTGYVQSKIKEMVETLEEEHLVTRNSILAGIKREAHNFGEDSNSMARTGAYKLLAQLRGMLIKKTESKVEHRGGVMVVPMPSAGQWEQVALESQTALKHEVRK